MMMRFAPTQLDKLIFGTLTNPNLEICKKINATIEKKEIDFKSAASLNQTLEYLRIETEDKIYYVLCVVKDSANKENEKQVPWSRDAIKRILQQINAEEKNKENPKPIEVLFPHYLCDEFCKFQWMPTSLWSPFKRKHVIFGRIIVDKHLEVHDPQSNIPCTFYPDIFNQEPLENIKYNYSENYHTYGVQSMWGDECGYYAFQYILSLLEHGDTSKFAEIKIDLTQFATKQAYCDLYEVSLAEQDPDPEWLGRSQQSVVIGKP